MSQNLVRAAICSSKWSQDFGDNVTVVFSCVHAASEMTTLAHRLDRTTKVVTLPRAAWTDYLISLFWTSNRTLASLALNFVFRHQHADLVFRGWSLVLFENAQKRWTVHRMSGFKIKKVHLFISVCWFTACLNNNEGKEINLSFIYIIWKIRRHIRKLWPFLVQTSLELLLYLGSPLTAGQCCRVINLSIIVSISS